MTNGDAVRDSDWLFDGGYTGEYSQGYYMSQTDIAAPYLFTGDFEAEVEFYLKVLLGEDIYRYAIRLVDPNWENSTTRRYYSFAAYYTAFPEHVDAYYQVSQGNGSYSYSDIDGNVPGIVNGVNTCTLVRSGNTISLYMNDTFIRLTTITASNAPSVGYAPFIHGHNSTDPADSNFYLRKVTVRYKAGERVYHDWNL